MRSARKKAKAVEGGQLLAPCGTQDADDGAAQRPQHGVADREAVDAYCCREDPQPVPQSEEEADVAEYVKCSFSYVEALSQYRFQGIGQAQLHEADAGEYGRGYADGPRGDAVFLCLVGQAESYLHDGGRLGSCTGHRCMVVAMEGVEPPHMVLQTNALPLSYITEAKLRLSLYYHKLDVGGADCDEVSAYLGDVAFFGTGS